MGGYREISVKLGIWTADFKHLRTNPDPKLDARAVAIDDFDRIDMQAASASEL
jgi:hypothetical protein